MTRFILFTLGTRGSPLALAQANEARRRLAEAHGWEIERIALQVIRTSGDKIQDRPLADAGGRGLFTKEIDAALLAGAIDAAAHSAKDLPSAMPHGVAIGACLLAAAASLLRGGRYHHVDEPVTRGPGPSRQLRATKPEEQHAS